MIDQISFQTAARTVDHLGREQIADAPTAVSELWKNAFDAYARNVELNVYGDGSSIATILDDGHGMNRDEFIGRWLVVGTESKVTGGETPSKDRDGLPLRPKQGQKGIGRLSCANLAPMLLLLSKRRGQNCVAALLDWRLFENPYLTLADIKIPVVSVQHASDVLAQLPDLVAQLSENLRGGADEAHRVRVQSAWKAFDKLHEDDLKDGTASRVAAPSQLIFSSLENLSIRPDHLERWDAWTDPDGHGTALVLIGVGHDLKSLCQDRKTAEPSAAAAIDRFHQTLSSFVDPFVDPAHPELNAVDPHFSFSVRCVSSHGEKWILGADKQLSRLQLERLEHHIEGRIDADGVFRGRVKAFGQWLDEPCVIAPPTDLEIPTRADTFLGPLDLFIASMEFSRRNTSQTDEEFGQFDRLAKQYAGFLMYRDGLRVLPFGRPDNDFFEIESRRTHHAGREFWNHRQMFGRLALSRRRNPNLRDKAGREGLLDNRAAKTLKAIVANILKESARRYFGTASDLRKELLPEVQDANARKRATEAREKLAKKQRSEFRVRLHETLDQLPGFALEVDDQAGKLEIRNESSAIAAHVAVERLQQRFVDFRLPEAPRPLGSLEEDYEEYRREMGALKVRLTELTEQFDAALGAARLSEPEVVLADQRRRAVNRINARLQEWKIDIDRLQKDEFARLRQLLAGRKEAFEQAAEAVAVRLKGGEIDLASASKLLTDVQLRMDQESHDLFTPYIGALESLGQSIDLQGLAAAGMEEVAELRGDLDRLNSLAQLGIAVEIVGHELESFDEIISSGLRALPETIRESKAARDIAFGHEGLTDQLRFLSPLRLAGQRTNEWITGRDLFEYLADFFKLPFAKSGIKLEASPEFLSFRVYDQKSRLLPVFINLLNNSLYWLSTTQTAERRVLLSVKGNAVLVSDTGPGVVSEDIASLFTLFFTRRLRGGRGVGLYLSRANLTAGGHRIRYGVEPEDQALPGANFLIEFRGGEFNAAG